VGVGVREDRGQVGGRYLMLIGYGYWCQRGSRSGHWSGVGT